MTEWITQPQARDENKSPLANKHRDRGSIRCACGAAVSLNDAAHAPDYAAGCPRCGGLYNLSGQALRARSQWEE